MSRCISHAVRASCHCCNLLPGRGSRGIALALLAFAAWTASGCVAIGRELSPPNAATTALREPLNSERIAQRFGSYGVAVLEADAKIRVSNLYSGNGEDQVCRTFAVVVFAADRNPRLAAEHQLIVDGGSIGAVFRQHGWSITKRSRLVTSIAPPAPTDRVSQLMALDGSSPLALEIYTFRVRRDDIEVDYATIAELHHPEHFTLAELRSLRGDQVPSTTGDPELRSIFELLERAMRDPIHRTNAR